MIKRKFIITSALTLTLFFGLATVTFADEMSGMNMGGNSTMQNGTQEATPGMNPNMPGMNMPNSTLAPNDQHQATPGMDPNMPGMGNADQHSQGASEGVSWPLVGGFSLVNLLIITTAGLLKFKAKSLI